MSRRFIVAIGIAIMTFVLPAGQQASGQTPVADARYDLVFRNVDIPTALDRLVEATGISLLYDTKEISESTVYCTGRDQSAEEILRCILSAGALDFYRLSSGTYVVIRSATREPDRGLLAGVVVDYDTGEPLPYANVYFADASGGVATNNAGQFSLGPVVAGEHRIVASYVGYRPYSDTLIVPANGTNRKRIALKADAVRVTPIVVNGMQQERMSAALGSGTIDTSPLESTGRFADVIKLAAEIEGVRSGMSFADLHVQGGESGEHVVLLDGAPIFQPVSLGRLLGSFSPLAVGRITVHKAGFEAQYGSRLSGVVAIDHDMSDSRADRFSVMADPFSINARASFGSRSATAPHAIVAVRRSLWNSYRIPAVESMLRQWNSSDPLLTATILSPSTGFSAATPHSHASELGFTDVHAAARLPIDLFRSLSASAYYGESRVSTELLASEVLPSDAGSETRFSLSQDRYRWTNSMAQVRYDWIAGARWLASAKLRYSAHHLTDRFGLADSRSLSLTGSVPEVENDLRNVLAASDGDDTANSFSEGALELRSTFSLGTRQQLDLGADVVVSQNEFRQQSELFRAIDLDGSDWKFPGFANYELRISDKTRFDLGSRLTYVPTRRTAYAEPRLSMRYDDSSTLLGTYSVRLATGIYRQFVNPFDLSSAGPSAVMPFVRLWLPTDATVGPAAAYHASMEFLAAPGDGWRIRAEGFAKWLPRFYSIDYSVLLDTSDESALTEEQSFIEEGTGRTFGATARLERNTERMDFAASYGYELNRRLYPSRIGPSEVAAPWSQPHRLGAHVRLFAGSGLSVRTRVQAVIGRTWGFRQSYYDFLASHNSATAFPPYDLKAPESHRLPAILQIDAGIGYSRSIAGSQVRINLDVLNVIDRKNVADWSLQALTAAGDTFGVRERYLAGIQPMLALEVGF